MDASSGSVCGAGGGMLSGFCVLVGLVLLCGGVGWGVVVFFCAVGGGIPPSPPSLCRPMSVILQESVIFTGSVRENVDPFRENGDEVIWDRVG